MCLSMNGGYTVRPLHCMYIVRYQYRFLKRTGFKYLKNNTKLFPEPVSISVFIDPLFTLLRFSSKQSISSAFFGEMVVITTKDMTVWSICCKNSNCTLFFAAHCLSCCCFGFVSAFPDLRPDTSHCFKSPLFL